MTNLFLNFLLESSVCLLLFMAAYKLLISNLTHFSWMRFYILASAILSLILPLVIVPISWHTEVTSTKLFTDTFISQINQLQTIGTGSTQFNPTQMLSGINLQMAILYSIFTLYAIGFSYKAFCIIRNLTTIRKFIKNSPKEKEGAYWVIRFKDEIPAFSFFNYIFINNNYKNLTNKDLQLIKNHEIVHVKQHHTIDILFLELISLVFWFNPIIKYLKKSIQEVHEYIVDEQIAGHGEQKKAYAQLLLNLASETKTFSLVASFTGEHIKQRILMVAKPKTLPIYKLSFIILVPLTAIMLLSFSYIKSPRAHEEISDKNNQEITTNHKIGKITWVGNTVYSTDELNESIGYKKGDCFSFDDLSNIVSGGKVANLYLDNGYVFFKADFATNDRGNAEYDITITIYEGVIARMGDIIIAGNTSVPSSQLLEKIKIHTGDLFNKAKIMNAINTLAETAKINPKRIEPVPIPNQEKQTNDYAVVDLVFKVSEN